MVSDVVDLWIEVWHYFFWAHRVDDEPQVSDFVEILAAHRRL